MSKKHFNNLEKINQETIIKEMQNAVETATNLYKPLYRIYSNEQIEETILAIRDIIVEFSGSKKDGLNPVVISEFVNFILHTDFGVGSHIDSEYVYKTLLTNEEPKYNGMSLGKYLTELQKTRH
jgi:hypothetical protein